MTKLVLKSFLLFCLMALVFAALWISPGRYPHDLAAIVNKRNMLSSVPPPRIIFMGGSSLLSLNGPAIERATGRRVVNMGLWGGLSLRRYLDEIRSEFKSGDVIMITQEYSTVLDKNYVRFINTNEESKKFLFLLSPRSHAARYIREGRWFDLFILTMQLVQMKNKAFIQNLVTGRWDKLCSDGYISYEEEFDAHGDRKRPFKQLRPLDSAGIVFGPPDMNNHLFLNSFSRFARERGVRVLYYFSHFPENEYRRNRAVIEELHRRLKQELDLEIINAPADMAYPEDCFADTVYHLNTKGEAIRTDAIIRLLKKRL